MAGTIVADIIQSDQSYASSINIASPLVISNTLTFGGGTITPTANVNIDNGTLFINPTKNQIGIGTITPRANLDIRGINTSSFTTETTSNVQAVRIVTGGGNGLPADGMEFFLAHANGYVGWVASMTANTTGSGWGSAYLDIDTSGTSGYTIPTMRLGNGYVTKPGQVSFMYWMGDSSTTYNPTTAGSVTIFRGTLAGNHNNGPWSSGKYDITTGRFTAPVTGYYHFDLHWIVNTTTSSVEQNYGIRVNGTVIADGRCRGYTESSGQVSLNLSLSKNDYVEVVKNDSGGVQMYTSSLYSWFSGFLIG